MTPFRRPSFAIDKTEMSDKQTDVLLAMTDKAFRAEMHAYASIERTTFRYATTLLAASVVLLSDRIAIEGVWPKCVTSIAIILFALIATIELHLKRKQLQNLSKVLVHMEDLLGCYTPNSFVDNATLLPEEWLNTGNYIGRKVTYVRFTIFWGMAILGCAVIWLANAG